MRGLQQGAADPQGSPVDKIASLLQYASTGDVEGVRQILDGGLSVNARDYDGRTALHLAASEGNLGVVKLLLERNAKVNIVDRWQDTVSSAEPYMSNVLHLSNLRDSSSDHDT